MRLSVVASLVTVVLAADYSGPLRPQVHFSPPNGFMNDPNGLFYDAKRDTYHLYYQYNPSGLVAGNQHWGHATTKSPGDLYSWTNQPIAIYPDSSDHLIFSGSAVVDSENTSGFFPNQDDGVVAIYTVDTPDIESQHIAYSTDGGYTFTKYANNPVINSTTKNFRDPQVVWHSETQKWIMTVSYAQDLVIAFYSSSNLREWVHESNFTQPGLPGDQFECPNLVKFSVDTADSNEGSKYVLFISVNPGAPLGGSGTFYLVGDFNGTHFVSETSTETLLDFAMDDYASQWYSNIPDGKPPVSIGWASNWNYTEDVPSGPLEGWRGTQTLPRIHTLTKVGGVWTVTSSPFNDLSSARGQHLVSRFVSGDSGSIDFTKVQSNALYFEVEIQGVPTSQPHGRVNFNFTSSQSADFLDGGLHLDTGLFWINRAGTRNFTATDGVEFTPTFNTRVPSLSTKDRFKFSGVIDRSVLEVFLNAGEKHGTVSFYPTTPLDILTISTEELSEQTTVHVDAWGLRSGWTE